MRLGKNCGWIVVALLMSFWVGCASGEAPTGEEDPLVDDPTDTQPPPGDPNEDTPSSKDPTEVNDNPLCGNGIIDEDEACDDGTDEQGQPLNGQPNFCNADCTGTTTPVCGNGVREEGEMCDDGDDNGTPNNCADDCQGTTTPVCGNNVVEDGEACDDGDSNGSPNSCAIGCQDITTPVCGNNAVEDGEACDDGDDNGTPNHCADDCQGTTTSVCGNGIPEDGEACDDGEHNGEFDYCNSECTGKQGAICGNHIVEGDEQCDDGKETSDCNANCTTARCGDGIKNASAGETCDDGDKNGQLNHCNTTCNGIVLPKTCGNGIVEEWEQCDEGPDMPKNDCNDCRFWPGYDDEPVDVGPVRQWTYHQPAGTFCRDGSQAGFAINVGPDPSKVMFYFMGGGACFEGLNCAANPASAAGNETPAPIGVFRGDEPRNPFKDWTWVWVPYCTGDVHIGRQPNGKIYEYIPIVSDLVGRIDVTGLVGGTRFVGDSNMETFLGHLVPTLQAMGPVTHVASVGMSAGGISATVNGKRFARAFPQARVTVLDDSGPPMPTSMATTCVQKLWRETWKLEESAMLDCGWGCPDPNNFLMPFATALVRDSDRIDFGYFGFGQHDQAIGALFGFGAGTGCGDAINGLLNGLDPGRYQNALRELRSAMHDAGNGRTAFYFKKGGVGHTCTQDDCMYGMTQDGVGLPEWIGSLLQRDFYDIGDLGN